MNWKYNKLADEDTNPRYQATNRDARPDTARDRPLTRTKTNEKNLNNSNDISFSKNKDNGNLDDENTVKDLDNEGQLKNGDRNGKFNEDNENVFDNPYDENGYAKKTGSPKGEIEDEDPLQAIKRKLKQDFNSKIKTSTIKQH